MSGLFAYALTLTRCETTNARTRHACCGAKTICAFFCASPGGRRNTSCRFALDCMLESDLRDISMRTTIATTLVACLGVFGFAATAGADSYSKAVKQSCAADYHKYCGDYGLESAALRICMDKAGKSLSKGCVNALIASGEVSQAEVNRRKNR